ncbi:MAG: flavodoxin family protein [Deltaproteobacteria bacterium]|nr:flavodoxin family protein [Deltaproteobacteria bacterium]
MKKGKTALVLNGSPRAKGNTAVVTQWFENALRRNGWAVTRFELHRLSYKGCAHCSTTCKKTSDRPGCALDDHLTPVLDEIAAARLIAIASPIYCWSVSGCTKAALDRFYCLFKNNGSLADGKKMVGLFTAGGDAFAGADLAVEMLKRIAEYGKAECAGTIAATGCDSPADLRRRKDIKAAVDALAGKL